MRSRNFILPLLLALPLVAAADWQTVWVPREKEVRIVDEGAPEVCIAVEAVRLVEPVDPYLLDPAEHDCVNDGELVISPNYGEPCD